MPSKMEIQLKSPKLFALFGKNPEFLTFRGALKQQKIMKKI